ncbi:hypothetical protein [Natronocalculus amylovorans]|uniref:Uncharacterized protein n=1 Tax=Natronocalculus amylovorans TaxID=2917812 RepID=A0AAE3FX40_9EURY|nr:hypothetical protein [Natronocalculus amylovorans]MCL9816968.1 hypothetical protein [Natronocalculus amylovorans]NUE02970.1 hypothetical protein [Halorubraceae archaeon YAN]
MSILGSLVAFIVGLLVGGLAIYIGARVVVDVNDYSHAVFTALIGALVWAIAAFTVGWIPLIGWIFPLLAWIWVINWRYPGGWKDAALLGFIAWIAALLVLIVLPFGAIGVPGV